MPSFVGSKQAVRDAIRLLPDGELVWQRLQTQSLRQAASLTPAGLWRSGLFCAAAAPRAVALSSSATRPGTATMDPERVDLRQAALDWMAAQRLFDGDLGMEREDVYFENTREEKLERIASLSPDAFHRRSRRGARVTRHFPPNIHRILFTGDGAPTAAPYAVCPDLAENRGADHIERA